MAKRFAGGNSEVALYRMNADGSRLIAIYEVRMAARPKG